MILGEKKIKEKIAELKGTKLSEEEKKKIESIRENIRKYQPYEFPKSKPQAKK